MLPGWSDDLAPEYRPYVTLGSRGKDDRFRARSSKLPGISQADSDGATAMDPAFPSRCAKVTSAERWDWSTRAATVSPKYAPTGAECMAPPLPIEPPPLDMLPATEAVRNRPGRFGGFASEDHPCATLSTLRLDPSSDGKTRAESAREIRRVWFGRLSMSRTRPIRTWQAFPRKIVRNRRNLPG